MDYAEFRDGVHAQITNLWNEYAAAKGSLDDANNEIASLRRQILEARDELDSESELRHKAENELEAIKAEHAKLIKDNDVLDERNALLELSVSKANKTIKELADKLSTAKPKRRFNLKSILRWINPVVVLIAVVVIFMFAAPFLTTYAGEPPLPTPVIIIYYIIPLWFAWFFWWLEHD